MKTDRLELIYSLLDRCEPLRKVMALSMLEFNRLVFKKDYKSLSTGFLSDDSRPVPNTIFEIIYNSYEWTTKTFKDLGIIISKIELEQLRLDVKDVVSKWIIKSNYQPPLFNKKLLRMKEPVAPELNLVFYLWFSARLKTNNPELDFEGIYQLRLLGNSPLHYNLKEGSKFSANTVKLFKHTIEDWIIQESKSSNKDLRKLEIYQSTLNVIGFYAQIRRLDLRGTIKGRQPSKRGDFNKEQAMVYNVILGLGRHLGFDPIFFTPIEDRLFDMNQKVQDMLKALGEKIYIFQRHHFRDNPDRSSILLMDQVLINKKDHEFWEKIVTEEEALVATQVIESLVKYKDPITENDIRSEFNKFGEKYLWIMEKWFIDPNFEYNRELFNIRKDYIKTKSLNQFIKDEYPMAYSRFYNTLLKRRRVSVREIIEMLHPNVDVTELINLGTNDDHIGPYTRIFTEIMRLFNYPTHF